MASRGTDGDPTRDGLRVPRRADSSIIRSACMRSVIVVSVLMALLAYLLCGCARHIRYPRVLVHEPPLLPWRRAGGLPGGGDKTSLCPTPEAAPVASTRISVPTTSRTSANSRLGVPNSSACIGSLSTRRDSTTSSARDGRLSGPTWWPPVRACSRGRQSSTGLDHAVVTSAPPSAQRRCVSVTAATPPVQRFKIGSRRTLSGDAIVTVCALAVPLHTLPSAASSRARSTPTRAPDRRRSRSTAAQVW